MQEPLSLVDTVDTESAYREIADEIWSAISGPFGKEPQDEWRCPWHGLAKLPTNPFTGQPFKGSNVLRLWSAWRKRGYQSHFWASAKAWEKAGARIVDPDAAVRIFMPVLDENRLVRWGKGSRNMGPLGYSPEGGTRFALLGFRLGHVINRDETEGGDIPEERGPAAFESIAEAENLIGAYIANQGPVLLHGGTRAYYSSSHDRIQMPPKEAFGERRGLSGAHWYSATLIHEAVHSTGNKSRLSRNLQSSFGSRAHAAEELVAELGAAFLGAELGLSTDLRSDHQDYVRSWITILKDRRREFFTATSRAQKAIAYIKAQANAGRSISSTM